MRKFRHLLQLWLIAFFLIPASCSRKKNTRIYNSPADSLQQIRANVLKILDSSIQFISDSLWRRDPSLLRQYVKKYHPDTCCTINFQSRLLKSEFEGPGLPGDINGDNRPDTCYIFKEFNLCATGQTYLFTDSTLPHLRTTSFCCHPRNLFSAGDIDEDGIQEIGLFHSTCSSRYKSVYVYSLKNGNWMKTGSVVFDQQYSDPEKPYTSFIRKTGKGHFEMLEISDLNQTIPGKPVWRKFAMPLP